MLDVLSGRRTAADVCREYQLKDDMFSRWKAQFLANAPKLFEREHLADHCDLVQPSLQQEIGQQGVRSSAPQAALAPNPESFGAWAADPAPVPTPPAEPPPTIAACMLAYLDLLPQREIGRHVQRTPPYDRHRVDLHPMSPLGLTRTGRAPFLLLFYRC